MRTILLVLTILASTTVIAQRPLEAFDRVTVFGNIKLTLKQSDHHTVTAEDEPDLKIRVEDGRLKISHKHNQKMWSNPTLVEVTYKDLTSLSVSAGATALHDGVLTADRIQLSADAGATIRVTLDAGDVEALTGEGGVMKLEGKSKTLEAKGTTGSVLKAMDLVSESVDASSNTGASLSVHAVKRIEATATLGGNITYDGDPEIVRISETLGGNVRG